jgi:hypothetical protein
MTAIYDVTTTGYGLVHTQPRSSIGFCRLCREMRIRILG